MKIRLEVPESEEMSNLNIGQFMEIHLCNRHERYIVCEIDWNKFIQSIKLDQEVKND